jgi:hypothetical protein
MTPPIRQTRNGKAIAPVVDIFPQLCQGFHDRVRVRDEMRLLKALGSDRVYFVLCNPGYPQFSKPQTAPLPPHPNVDNHAVRSIMALGDPNRVYCDECHRQGMEAWGIFKPYECGGGITVPHGAVMSTSNAHVECVGGERVMFDELLSHRPELRLARRPDPQTDRQKDQPIIAVELAFCLDPFTDRQGYQRSSEFQGISDAEVPNPKLTLWTSRDNGRYTRFEGAPQCSRRIESRPITDANGLPVSDGPKRCLVLTLDGFSLPPDVPYLAVSLSDGDWEQLPTIPASMVKAFGPCGEIAATVDTHSRSSIHPREATRPPEDRDWSFPGDLDRRARHFAEWGFEFEWHGAGFWGDGWRFSPAYGIGRGKMPFMKGTPCEGFEEVRQYWLETVRHAVAMGYDGLDIRLQNHSGMLGDYVNYGFNEPIARRYREKHGVDILKSTPDPLELMRVRGEFFGMFLEQSAACLHDAGRKLQVHLRHCHEEPRLSSDFNQLGFWAMPRVLLDWRKAIDLADEVTIKDYYFNDYRPGMAPRIKQYAREQGKRAWIHCYIYQGRELNDDFFAAVEADPLVGGILLYEVSHAGAGTVERNYGLIEQVGPVGYNEEAVEVLRSNLERLGYGLPP